MRLLTSYFFLFFSGILGGCISKSISRGEIIVWASLMPSAIAGVIWGLIAKESTNLSFSVALYNVIFSSGFIIGLLTMGDRLSSSQIVGFVIALIGTVVMTR